MLELLDYSAGYGKKTVLRHISLTILPGQVTILLGPNGSGKSTLLKSLCGLLPSTGVVRLDGSLLDALSARQRARKLTYLAQNRLIPDITVQKLVLHGRFPYLSYPRRYRQTDYTAAQNAMEQMGIAALADVRLGNLSGGQRQKVYIAMALAQNTPVVLFDEPTTFLDVGTQLQIMQQARCLAAQGKTVLMVLHDIAQAMQFADQLVLMNEGTVVCTGTPQAVFASGALDRVFSVKINQVIAEGVCHYYCEEAKKS